MSPQCQLLSNITQFEPTDMRKMINFHELLGKLPYKAWSFGGADIPSLFHIPILKRLFVCANE
jgi:hypothetical protein